MSVEISGSASSYMNSTHVDGRQPQHRRHICRNHSGQFHHQDRRGHLDSDGQQHLHRHHHHQRRCAANRRRRKTGSLGAGGVTDNASLIFNHYDNVVRSNSITGSGSLTQAGDGVLTLAAANTYSGSTYISAGTLALTNSGSIAGSTNINLANGAVFDISGSASQSMTLASAK